ncbi:MAG: 30S ribosomal protein S3 [Euryarchaeota archaeon]|nr:30S ribosomal protein S3 [Euryarchaeota archaeon]
MASERKFIAENIRRTLLKEYLMKTIDRAGFGGVDVQRTPMGTRVTLITERPGIVIGRRGSAIKTLTKAIEDNFKYDNPQIEVQEVDNPNLNAQIMAEKLAFALERGWHFRRAGHSTVRRIMDNGARGCLIILSGKLTGERHRTEKFKEGYIKYCGDSRLKFIRTGFAVAKLKPGVVGVKVEIMDPDARLPAEIDVLGLEQAKLALPDMIEQLIPKNDIPDAIAVHDPEPVEADVGKPDTREVSI